MPRKPQKTEYEILVQQHFGKGFRFGKSARYWLGERLCRRCQFIHPPHYKEDTCTLCGKRLASAPRASGRKKNWKYLYPHKFKRIDIDALLQNSEET